VDTEGGFSFERFGQICPDSREALKKISLVRPQDFEAQGRTVRALKSKQADLIVVDSVVALFRLECSPEGNYTFEAGKELSRQLSILSNIAVERSIPVIITSHSFRRRDGPAEVIGGDVIKYWSKSLILLEKTGRSSERKATIVKHRWLPEEKSVKFNIVHEGIKPAGFRIF
jgi:DNA repair protein RadB